MKTRGVDTGIQIVIHEDEGEFALYDEVSHQIVAACIPSRHQADVLAAAFDLRDALRMIKDQGGLDRVGVLAADAANIALAKSNGAA